MHLLTVSCCTLTCDKRVPHPSQTGSASAVFFTTDNSARRQRYKRRRRRQTPASKNNTGIRRASNDLGLQSTMLVRILILRTLIEVAVLCLGCQSTTHNLKITMNEYRSYNSIASSANSFIRMDVPNRLSST